MSEPECGARHDDVTSIVCHLPAGHNGPHEGVEEHEEAPRAETDCKCLIGDETCPCEADGPDGLCRCCRDNEHCGACADPAPVP